MSMARDSRPFSKRHLEVTCSCGKSLRAGIEAAGGSIQCWSCRASVPVPIPRDPQLTRSVLQRGLLRVFAAWSLAAIGGGVVVLVGLMMLPLPGPVQTGLGLACVSIVYGELIRRGSWAAVGPITMIFRVILTLLISLLPMTPWLLLRETGGINRPPALYGGAVWVAAGLAVLVPFLMMILWGARYPGRVARAVLHHPCATLAALLIVPLGLVAGEVLGVALTSFQGMFSYYVLDLYPEAPRIAPRFGIPLAGNYDFPVVPDQAHWQIYRYWVYRGMPLSMALPASLGSNLTPGHSPWPIEMLWSNYYRMRAFHTAILAVVWLTTLAIQSYWLGLIARLDARYDVVKHAPET